MPGAAVIDRNQFETLNELYDSEQLAADSNTDAFHAFQCAGYGQ